MLINLAFIKATNGLFYFALDYIAALEDTISSILVRTPEQAAILGELSMSCAVRIVTPLEAAFAIRAASKRGEMTFTPSSHPIPGCARQMVVVHDTFPFRGHKGRVKAAMFLLALRTCRAHAGYINHCDARAFLLRGGVPQARIHSTPNHMTLPDKRMTDDTFKISDRVSIGLFGTDSPKKNYPMLFTTLAASPDVERLRLILYGQPNAYADDLIARFPALQISVCNSREHDLSSFVNAVDLLASAATQEGFSRPIAAALAAGVPCWIVDAPVFREFYGEAAVLHDNIERLAEALLSLTPGMSIERPDYSLPSTLEEDFRESVAWLREQDLKSS